jgi:hypothetical protein
MRCRAVARRIDGRWAIETPTMAADALSLWLERPVSPDDIDVAVRDPTA